MHEEPTDDWLTPHWWHTDHDPTISRNKLTHKWATAAPPPKPELVVFVDELRGWSNVLGRCDWVADRYTATAATLAYVRVNSHVGDAQAWWDYSLLLAHFGDPLARFTGSFAVEARTRRPVGLPQKISRSLRDKQRSVPTAVRNALADPLSEIYMLDSEATAEHFLHTTEEHYDNSLSIAMRSYAGALIEYLDQNDSLDPNVRAAIEDSIESLTEFGEPIIIADILRRAPTAEESALAHRLISDLVEGNPHLRKEPDDLHDGWVKAHTILTNWMIDGREVTNALILFTAVQHARRDRIRIEARNSWEDIFSEDGSDNPSAATAGPRDDSLDRAEIRTLIDQMRARLIDTAETVTINGNAVDCWEKIHALKLLKHGTQIAGLVDFGHLHETVEELWIDGRPDDARCNTPAQAADDIQKMLQIAAATVLESAADLNLARAKSPKKSSSERTAEVTNTLNRIRNEHRGRKGAELEEQ